MNSTPDDRPASSALSRYWQANLKVMLLLLSVWALVGLGFGVLLADWLNGYRLAGFPIGFWFAQQGSILVFIALILIYAVVLNRLDSRHQEEVAAEAERSAIAQRLHQD